MATKRITKAEEWQLRDDLDAAQKRISDLVWQAEHELKHANEVAAEVLGYKKPTERGDGCGVCGVLNDSRRTILELRSQVRKLKRQVTAKNKGLRWSIAAIEAAKEAGLLESGEGPEDPVEVEYEQNLKPIREALSLRTKGKRR